MDGHHDRDGCWTFGELWYAIFKPETYPSMADAGYIAFYLLLYVGHRPPASLACALDRGDALARRRRRPHWLPAALGAAVIFEIVVGATEGSTSVVVTNLAYPLGDVLLLSAVFGVFSLTGWKARAGAGSCSASASCRRRPRTSSTSSSRPKARTSKGRGSTSCGRRRFCSSRRPPGWSTARAKGSRSKVDRFSPFLPSVRCRHGNPRLRPLHPRQPARDRPRLGNARARRRPARRHVPREPPPLRADTRRRRRPMR